MNVTSIPLIIKERLKQINELGRTITWNRENNANYQLVHAAARISWAPGDEGFDLMREPLFIPEGWDKDFWNKMLDKSYKDRLIIAASLICAEIDRISE